MKKLLIALMLIPMFFGCNSNTDDKRGEENVALITKYVKSVENLDYVVMATVLDDNYIGIGPSYADSTNKPEALKNWRDLVDNLYEKIEYKRSRNIAVTIKNGPEKGDWVSNWADLHIVYKNGKEVSLFSNTIYMIKDGKIIKSYTIYNEADALRQMGYVSINPDNL